MRLQPKHKMIGNMLRYGTVLGGLAGALSTVMLILTASTFQFLGTTLPVMLIETLSIAVFGLIFGGIIGMLVGMCSGLAMAFMTTVFYTDIQSRNTYKIAMGIITAICTALFLTTQLWHLRLDGMSQSSWNMTMVILVGFAIYASQRVASTYLFEWSIRKQKA